MIDETPPPGRQLMMDGKWVVPVSERPKDWKVIESSTGPDPSKSTGPVLERLNGRGRPKRA